MRDIYLGIASLLVALTVYNIISRRRDQRKLHAEMRNLREEVLHIALGQDHPHDPTPPPGGKLKVIKGGKAAGVVLAAMVMWLRRYRPKVIAGGGILLVAATIALVASIPLAHGPFSTSPTRQSRSASTPSFTFASLTGGSSRQALAEPLTITYSPQNIEASPTGVAAEVAVPRSPSSTRPSPATTSLTSSTETSSEPSTTGTFDACLIGVQVANLLSVCVD